MFRCCIVRVLLPSVSSGGRSTSSLLASEGGSCDGMTGSWKSKYKNPAKYPLKHSNRNPLKYPLMVLLFWKNVFRIMFAWIRKKSVFRGALRQCFCTETLRSCGDFTRKGIQLFHLIKSQIHSSGPKDTGLKLCSRGGTPTADRGQFTQ